MTGPSGASLLLANTMIAKKLQDDDLALVQPRAKNRDYEWQVVWRNVFAFVYLHIAALYGFYLIFTGNVKFATILFGIFFAIMSAMGVTAGAHRLWAHRAYKARWPLRVYLALMQTMAFQNHIYEWVRDHRVHHKFTETDADPHNARRGFFFSHIGWLMVRKHKDVFEKGASVDMSDLEKDPIVMFQKKTYLVLMPLLCFIIPAWIPVYFWGENAWISWYVASITRYTVSLHFTWLVNSAAHIWGNRPYDKNIGATDNQTVAICAFGEGWHNYHHVFPWDYKAAELGNYSTNLSTALIDWAAKHGLAYDLKTVSADMIRKRINRTGDGSHPWSKAGLETEDDHHHPENPVWGWDDQDMTQEEKQFAEIYHRKIENIGATDNQTVAICAFGEGWHNYHHVFPWDYKAAELGNYSTNLSTALIDWAAKHGLAYDLKTVSADMIRKRINRTGDGSHPWSKAGLETEDDHHHPENPVWGWDDQDMTQEEKQFAEIYHRKIE